MQENGHDRKGFLSSVNRKALAAGIICALAVVVGLAVFSQRKKPSEEPQPGPQTGETAEIAESEAASTKEEAETAGTEESAEGTSMESAPAEGADTGKTGGVQTAAARSPEMDELDRHLREELEKKDGDWSLYLYRFDTGEEIGINANEPMISASLIKLYIAGCYLEETAKGKIPDDYQNDLFLMLSQSDNDSTNRLIDLLGMDEINEFIQKHRYSAGQLNRKMLEKNGTENYTSAEDCGKVLRAVYQERFISRDASGRVMEALRAQIERNRMKIPAGVPEGVETANKTGELLTTNESGVSVFVQNDAAVVFAEDHPYVMVVMSAVSGVGEDEMHRQIAGLSSEVYSAVCGTQENTEETEETEDAENTGE